MTGQVLDVENTIGADKLARDISQRFEDWNQFRSKWLEEKTELRNYVFATDTKTTSNGKLPWANSTTRPKLAQIYDNLMANYGSALFPQTNWMRWETEVSEENTDRKKKVVQNWALSKVRRSGFIQTVLECLSDWVLTGNCFGQVVYEDNVYVNGATVTEGYRGPVLRRIAPQDICFNPLATSFEKSPKIVRTIKSLGELKRDEINSFGADDIYEKIIANRKAVTDSRRTSKSTGFVADGFSSIENYYESGYVELLTFYGDIFDKDSEEFKANRVITIVDRAYVLSDVPEESWLGSANIFKAGWRKRPDSLYAMGPLDNLVGMQYRIDHLENLRADVFDMIALPMLKIRGDVEDFDYVPGGRIIMGDEGDVGHLHPDTTSLNADFQINTLEVAMEEMAGAPKNAMGIRTPGEKTAFEVQALQNSSSRIFQNKAALFEREFIEPILNAFLETGRRNMPDVDPIKAVDEEGRISFINVTKEDISGPGSLVPIGARHFAERAQRTQNLNSLIQIKTMDQSIGVHLSGKELAKMLAYELGEEKVFEENVAIKEQTKLQEASQDAEADSQERMMVKQELGI